MTIDKAIELLSLSPITGDKALDRDMSQAMRLGVAALKQIQQVRALNLAIILEPLPGETWKQPPAIYHQGEAHGGRE